MTNVIAYGIGNEQELPPQYRYKSSKIKRSHLRSFIHTCALACAEIQAYNLLTRYWNSVEISQSFSFLSGVYQQESRIITRVYQSLI